jgi:hypothetical protein
MEAVTSQRESGTLLHQQRYQSCTFAVDFNTPSIILGSQFSMTLSQNAWHSLLLHPHSFLPVICGKSGKHTYMHRRVTLAGTLIDAHSEMWRNNELQFALIQLVSVIVKVVLKG